MQPPSNPSSPPDPLPLRPRGLTRRRFLRTVVGAAAAFGAVHAGASLAAADSSGKDAPKSSPQAPAEKASPAQRKKIALIATEVRKYSHAQHFLDRFLEGYGWHGEHHASLVELASLYVDQFPEGDLSRERERRRGVKIYPTIAEALTLGGAKLAVDGVVIIGEHGDYPSNAKGQKLYPRYRFHREVMKVFEASGKAAPVFNDKHLSTDWGECRQMVADASRLGFPYLAGSSLPVTWRIPSLEIPLGTPLEESLCVAYGGVDSYDIHGLESAQCLSERRAGGEVGVRAVHAARGARAWDLLLARNTTSRLLLAALSRSHTITPAEGYTCAVPTLSHAKKHCPEPTVYIVEHLDGFRTTLVLANGLVQDFNCAVKLKEKDEVLSCQMHLPMPPRISTLADFFNPLVNNVEEMIVTGKAPYPVERTLLMSGVVIFAVESLYRGEVRLLTPELDVAYAAPEASHHWRA